ncbi:hypothetical protein B0H13DRAFT_1852564 [Mycena leptocephala]|nr:hypothetical protein B0H13DRAFT_1852564 [Mycena leptocephala]
MGPPLAIHCTSLYLPNVFFIRHSHSGIASSGCAFPWKRRVRSSHVLSTPYTAGQPVLTKSTAARTSGTTECMPFSSTATIPSSTPRVVNFSQERVIEADRLTILQFIRKNLGEGMTKMIWLSQITTAKCLAANDGKEDRKGKPLFLLEGGALEAREKDDYEAADANLSAADFLTAGINLCKAIEQYYIPREQASILASQLRSHFETIQAKPDFLTHTRRYRIYHNNVFRAIVESPNFRVDRWQLELWADAVQRDRDQRRDRENANIVIQSPRRRWQ